MPSTVVIEQVTYGGDGEYVHRGDSTGPIGDDLEIQNHPKEYRK